MFSVEALDIDYLSLRSCGSLGDNLRPSSMDFKASSYFPNLNKATPFREYPLIKLESS